MIKLVLLLLFFWGEEGAFLRRQRVTNIPRPPSIDEQWRNRVPFTKFPTLKTPSRFLQIITCHISQSLYQSAPRATALLTIQYGVGGEWKLDGSFPAWWRGETKLQPHDAKWIAKEGVHLSPMLLMAGGKPTFQRTDLSILRHQRSTSRNLLNSSWFYLESFNKGHHEICFCFWCGSPLKPPLPLKEGVGKLCSTKNPTRM